MSTDSESLLTPRESAHRQMNADVALDSPEASELIKQASQSSRALKILRLIQLGL